MAETALAPDTARAPDAAATPSVYAFKDDLYSSHRQLLRLAGAGGGRRLLDVGAADGFLARRFAGQGWRGTAIEQDPTLAAQAAAHCEAVAVCDLNGPLPELEGRFDAIVYADVLEHLAQPGAVFRRLNQLLTPEGRLFVSMPNVAHLWIRLMLLSGRFDYADRGIMDRTHLRFFTRNTFRRFLEEHGMAISSLVPVPVPLFLAVPERFHGAWLRGLHRLNAAGARCWPTGLAYQFVADGHRRT